MTVGGHHSMHPTKHYLYARLIERRVIYIVPHDVNLFLNKKKEEEEENLSKTVLGIPSAKLVAV